MVAKRMMVPVDFSAASLEALDYAIALRRTAATEIVVVHVVDPALFPVLAVPYTGALDVTSLLAEQRRIAREQFDRIMARLNRARVKAQTRLVSGTTHSAIVSAADKFDADLIVMATHGRSGLSHLLLGSVAEKVARTAHCPVLLVRPGMKKAARHQADALAA